MQLRQLWQDRNVVEKNRSEQDARLPGEALLLCDIGMPMKCVGNLRDRNREL